MLVSERGGDQEGNNGAGGTYEKNTLKTYLKSLKTCCAQCRKRTEKVIVIVTITQSFRAEKVSIHERIPVG